MPRTLRNYAEKICIETSLFLYGNSPEMRETEGKFCGKDLSMKMSLFLYGNSAEMRETEGKSARKKQRHGNEIISVWNSAEMRETDGRSYTLNIFIYVSLIGRALTEHEKMSANNKFKQS